MLITVIYRLILLFNIIILKTKTKTLLNKMFQGRLIYDDGSQYVGQWKNKKKHGKGTMTYSDGVVYDGDFKFGKRQGKLKI